MNHEGGSIFFPEFISPVRRIGQREFDFDRQVAVAVILNRGADSFNIDEVVRSAEKAVADGADWVDVGGFPFSPARSAVSVSEETDRLIPLIEALRNATDAVISVETHRAEVAREAFAAGADVLNDTNGLRSPEIAAVAAVAEVAVVITHSIGGPDRYVPRPAYQDVVGEVKNFIQGRVSHAMQAGISAERIFVDPGYDLNKNTYHSLALAKRLSEITGMGPPAMVTVSNKDFVWETLNLEKDKCREGAIAMNVACILQGARILRVHDVRDTVIAAQMTEAILGWRSPLAPRHNLV